MRRQIGAVIFGVKVAVAAIYAVFDQRVSFREFVASSPATQSHNN
jgi:hypothetical protein